MNEYRLTPAARNDLSAVWDYTEQKWDGRQAEYYLRDIQSTMERVADDPERGQVRDDLRQRYRSYRIGRLVVFFVVRAYGVDIVRVLHQRMDPLRHLGGREPGLCVEIVAALGR